MYKCNGEEIMLASLSNLYLELEAISVSVSRLSSCSILYCLLTICTTNYCFKGILNNFNLRKSLLWQPLITKTNDHTSGKFLKLDIKWEVHKRTRQEVSAKLESYIY